MRLLGKDGWPSDDVVISSRDKEIASLRQQLAEAKKDAERYRWLREGGVYQWFDSTSNVSLDNLDAAIDQAMKGE